MEGVEVSVTLPPVQKLTVLAAVIIGVVAKGFTITLVSLEEAEVQIPSLTVKVKVPEALTVIDLVLAPFDQR